MKRYLLALIVIVLATPAAQAHFIWIVPDKDGTARVIFSDSLKPDSPELLGKIAKAEAFTTGEDGKPNPLKWAESKDKNAYLVTVPGTGARLVNAACAYGVIARGDGEPFLLNYYATAVVGAAKDVPVPDFGKGSDRMPLRIVQFQKGISRFQVLWQGKPLAGEEVVVLEPSKDKGVEHKTDDQGMINVYGKESEAGVYGIRARYIEKRAGKQDGKEYKEVRHYATLVALVAINRIGPVDDKPKEDPAASKLLQEARAARAQWQSFPGFSANIEVNFDGKTSKGKVQVDSAGRLQFDGLDKNMEPWAKRTLGSVVGHRLDDSASKNTPCAFIDDNKDHPLGRAIRVLTDELHSSYRIRDRQIMEVNRQMKEGRFTISVLENRPNAEGKFLSIAFVVSFWSLENGELQRSEAHHQAWARVGKFDLPTTLTVITSQAEKSGAAGRIAQSLTLTNHKLLPGAK